MKIEISYVDKSKIKVILAVTHMGGHKRLFEKKKLDMALWIHSKPKAGALIRISSALFSILSNLTSIHFTCYLNTLNTLSPLGSCVLLKGDGKYNNKTKIIVKITECTLYRWIAEKYTVGKKKNVSLMIYNTFKILS